MKHTFILILLALFLAACTQAEAVPTDTNTPIPPTVTNSPVPPTATVTPEPTLTPTVTTTPQPTPTNFPLSELPGYIAFTSFYCENAESPWTTCIGYARADWSTYEIITTHSEGMAVDPLWSPDGRYIAYNFFVIAGENSYEDLRVYDFVTGQEISLTPNQVKTSIWDKAWSPDSGSLVVTMVDDDPEVIGTNLYVIDVPSKRMTPITTDSSVINESPVWSSAGDAIAFSSNRESQDPDNYDIWIVSPQGTGLTNLTGGEQDPGNDRSPSYSPDGSMIAFNRFSQEETGLWIMEADGSSPQMIYDMQQAPFAEMPVWAPDGNRLALVYGEEEYTRIVSVGLDDWYFEISEDAGNYYRVSWSPDSIAVIYSEDFGNRKFHLSLIGVESPFSMSTETPLDDVTWSPVAELP